MKTVIHALLTSLLLLSSVQTTVAQTLDEIVERHLAASGGRAALEKLTSRSMTGTITLTAAAPAGGLVVDLTTSKPTSATVPATVVVPEGNTAATFAVTTHRSAATAATTITATSGRIPNTTAFRW